ncbi:MAG: hypothetical protein JJE22_15450 [Bacteroidia bacterium]|nr:hypothetical protein [Bacteroidia bacterium]
MKKCTGLSIIFFCFIITARSQDFGYKTIDAGAEFQWYPAGYISALHLAYNFPIHHAIQVRIGYNKANRGDRGKHDDEEGGGPGFSLGYRYYFLVRPHGFFLGARSDIWHLNIDWKQGTSTGTSKIWVVQPTFEIGYMFLINDEFFISPSIANGAEINIKTQGQPVGESFITLAGISAGWKF